MMRLSAIAISIIVIAHPAMGVDLTAGGTQGSKRESATVAPRSSIRPPTGIARARAIAHQAAVEYIVDLVRCENVMEVSGRGGTWLVHKRRVTDALAELLGSRDAAIIRYEDVATAPLDENAGFISCGPFLQGHYYNLSARMAEYRRFTSSR